VHSLRRTYYRLGNHFGRHRWHSYVTWVKWKLILVHLEIVLISAQDKCMVCAECTIWQTFLVDQRELLGDVGEMEACFGPFGDCVNLDA
jgi:hypothetical protein